jgi:hypothetical protein
MIMDQDQRRGSQVKRTFDDLARINRRVIYRPALLPLVL